MKIVLDSNIFVSSFCWKGNPRKVFERVTNGLDENIEDKGTTPPFRLNLSHIASRKLVKGGNRRNLSK
jgi:hypothetical protein